MPTTTFSRVRIIRTIPEISDKLLFELYDKIKPVKHIGNFWYDEIEDAPGYSKRDYVTGVSFIWKIVLRSKPQMMFPIGNEVFAYHTWGAPALFKPSLAEVFAAIQHLDLTDVTHFCLESDTSQGVLSAPDEFCEDGYHKSKITLLTALLPEDIRKNGM